MSADDLELPELSRLEAVDVQPDDVLVLTVSREFSHETLEHLSVALKRYFPDNSAFVIVGDAKLEVIRGQAMSEHTPTELEDAVQGWQRILCAGLNGSAHLFVVCPVCFASVRRDDAIDHIDWHGQ